MIRVHVLYFALLREKVGTASAELNLPVGATVDDLWTVIEDAHPQVEGLGASTSFAVNQEYVERTRALADGDEVALIPPVSGGL